MTKSIILSGTQIEYDLQKKKVKNVNIRIKRDLTVHVSAPMKVSQVDIDRILIEKSDFILSALKKYEDLSHSAPKIFAKLDDGNLITIFGDIIPLSLQKGSQNRVEMAKGNLVLTVKDTEDIDLKKRLLQKHLDELCREMIESICADVHPCFAKYVPRMPEVKFRHMKSRWGSCNLTKNILTFNYALVHAPVDCIEYVVYHEFTHFIHQDHSKSFYSELSRFVPDYKEKRKRLAKVNIDLQ